MKILTPFLLLTFFIGIKLNAQDVVLLAGSNISKMQIVSESESDRIRTKEMGAQVGVGLDFELTERVSFFPQTHISFRREKVLFDILFIYLYTVEESISNYFLDVPLNFKYSLPVKKGAVDVFAGPYVGFQLRYNSSLRFIDPPARPFDYFTFQGDILDRIYNGYNLGFGYNVGSFMIHFTAELGLRSMSNPELFRDIEKAKNNVFKCSIGYKL